MRQFLLVLLLTVLTAGPALAYNDHRGHNLDSLERAVARWTPDAVDRASEEELIQLNRAYRDLMLGYQNLNQEKFVFYTRKALQISRSRDWNAANADALRYLGQYFYAREQHDSALVYFNDALACIERMENGATSPTQPEGYSASEIDDHKSALYGAIGNLYNMMGDIPKAMEYYEKAGQIFEKYGWNESNTILHYNMGETWVDEGDLRQARKEYLKSLDFATASGDSLMIVLAWKGLGRLYAEKGRNWKSLKYLRKADDYYATHPGESPKFRTENLNYMQEVLSHQKRQLGLLSGILTGLVLMALGFLLARRRKKAVAEPSEPSQPAVDAPEITDREKEILDLLANGYTTPQIAEALCLSPETIKWYRKKLLVKFDVANTAELVSAAKSHGVI